MSFTKRAVAAVACVTLLIALSTRMATKAQAPPAPYANFEVAQTNPIRLSADMTRLYAVNSANNSLSVFDVSNPASPGPPLEIPVGVGPVSVNPLTDDIVWVVNQVSNSISLVSVSEGIVTATIQVKPEPMDVVFANNNTQAYVSVGRLNAIAVYDTNTYALITVIPLFGDFPRNLAVSPDGSMVYAALALSGNATTLVPSPYAPPQPPPTNPALPPPPHTGLIVSANDPNWKKVIKWTMPDNDVAVINVNAGATPLLARYYNGVGTDNLGMAVNPATGDIFVANTDALNLTPFVTNLDGHWVNNRITRIQVATSTITAFDLNKGLNYGILPNPAALATALAQPYGVAFDPSGNFMYVAAFGTDRVAKVDTNGNVLGFVEVSQASGSGSNVDPVHKRGPRGLALNAGANTLYCLNRITDSISVINTSSFNSVSQEIPVGINPEPSQVKAGRGFLYDAKLSGTGTGACASCHVDGDMDHIDWNLGNPAGNMTSTVQGNVTILFHPMKGPMMTQSLRGLLNLSPYHWRGDKPNFAAFNSTFNQLMGGTVISTSDMNIYTQFINTVLYLPNPYENLDRSIPSSIPGIAGNPVTGQSDFLNLGLTEPGNVTCNFCHTSNPGPGSNRFIDDGQPGFPLKDVQLRNVYQKLQFNNAAGAETIDGFGLKHDGDASGFPDFFKDKSFRNYNSTQQTDIAAFSLCFDTGTAPAVGYTLTLNSTNLSSGEANWNTLQLQAGSGAIDLIARGTVQGVVSGLLYQPTTQMYLSNTGALYTQSQLEGFIGGTDTLSIMGVYPGTGTATK